MLSRPWGRGRQVFPQGFERATGRKEALREVLETVVGSATERVDYWLQVIDAEWHGARGDEDCYAEGLEQCVNDAAQHFIYLHRSVSRG